MRDVYLGHCDNVWAVAFLVFRCVDRFDGTPATVAMGERALALAVRITPATADNA